MWHLWCKLLTLGYKHAGNFLIIHNAVILKLRKVILFDRRAFMMVLVLYAYSNMGISVSCRLVMLMVSTVCHYTTL